MSNKKNSGNKSSDRNTQSKHAYLNTQKSTAHTKINKQLVQLWFGSAATPPSLTDSQGLKLFNAKTFETFDEYLSSLLKQLSLSALLQSLNKTHRIGAIAVGLLTLGGSNIAVAAPATACTNVEFSAANGDFSARPTWDGNRYVQQLGSNKVFYRKIKGSIASYTEPASSNQQLFARGTWVGYAYPSRSGSQIEITFEHPLTTRWGITDIDQKGEIYNIQIYDEDGVLIPNPQSFVSFTAKGTSGRYPNGVPTTFTDLGSRVDVSSPEAGTVRLARAPGSLSSGFYRPHIVFFDIGTKAISKIVIENAGAGAPGFLFSSVKEACPAEIYMSKTLASGGPVVEPGDALTYDISLVNVGDLNGTISVDERVPAGTTNVAGDSFDSACATGVVAGTVCTATSPKVLAGGTANMTFKVKVDDPLAESSIENVVVETGKPVPNCSAADQSDPRCVSTVVNTPPVTVSGKVINDANGNNVDGTGLGNPEGQTLYAHLISSVGTANEKVSHVVAVNADGSYQFDNVPGKANYDVLISTVQGVVGSAKPAITLPADWGQTAEGINGVGDANADGSTSISVATSNVSNVLFGLNKKPTAGDISAPSQPNPGGSSRVVVPALDIADKEDGTPKIVIIKTLPDAAKGTLYYNGNVVTAGEVINNFDANKLTIDPASGDVTPSFTYSTQDAAGVESDTATVTLPFNGLTISGKVLKDTDAGSVTGTGLGNPDATPLFANLIDAAGNVVATTQVAADGTYQLDDAAPNTTYQVQISSTQGSVGNAKPATVLPANWVATGEGLDGVTDASADGTTSIAIATSSVSNVLFGINKVSPPVAVDDSKSNPDPATPTNTTTINVVGNDTDPENNLDATTVKLVDPSGSPVTTLSVPNEGTWSVDGTTGAVTFTPEAGFTDDPTAVEYTIKDTTGVESNKATVTVDYPQTAPVAQDDSKTGITGTPTTVTVITNDSDPENDLDKTTVKLVDPNDSPVTTLTVPNEGKWDVDPLSGNVIFTPENGFIGDPTPVKYTLKDKTGKESNQATVSIDYPQTAPIAKNDARPGISGTPTTVEILLNDSDPENDLDPTTVNIIDPNGTPVTTLTVPNEGEWAVDPLTGKTTFTPENGFTSDPTPVKYTVKDKTGKESNQATITINYPQTAPVAINDSKSGLIPGTPGVLNVVTNDTDPENDLNPTTVKITSSVVAGAFIAADGKTMTVPNEGQWTVANDGNMTFTPDANFSGDPSPLRYTVADKTGKLSNEATVTLDYDSLRVISGHVGIDLTGDNTAEKDPLSPVTINLYKADGTTLIATTTTDQFGNYSFEAPGGNYIVKETDPAGVVSVTDKDGGNDNIIAVDSSAGSITDNDFVDRPQTGDVHGTVFKDDNQDAIHNNSELPLANINITVTDAYGVAHPVTTDANGDYSVTGIPVGPASIVVKSDDPDIPEGANATGSPAGTPATVTVPAGGVAEHDIGYFKPAVADIDPASVATCANPSSITWEGSTVSSRSVWSNMNAPASQSFTTVGGKQVGVTMSLADTDSQFNYADGSGTNAGIFNGPYLTMYLGKQANPSGADGFQLNSGDSATLTITFAEEVLLDNWRIRDIDSGDQRGGVAGWDWQDAVKMTGVDAQGNAVTIDTKLGSGTSLVKDANGYVHTNGAQAGIGTDADLPEGHVVYSSNGIPVKTITLIHKAGPDIASQTRAAIALSGFAICTPLEISGKVLNDGNGNNDGVTGNPVNQLEGAALYAHLVDETGTVIDNIAIANDGSYHFNKRINTNSNYTVVLSTIQTAKGISMPSPVLPVNWSNSSENTAADTAINGVIPVAMVTTAVSNVDFGVNKAPVAQDVNAPSQQNPGGSIKLAVSALQVTDNEDTTPSTIVIESLPVDGTLHYNGVPVTAGQVITGFDATKLLVDPEDGNKPVIFNYHTVDAAGVVSNTATVTMPFSFAVPTATDDAISNTVVGSNTIVDNLANDNQGAGAGSYPLDATTVKLISNDGSEVTSLTVADEGVWTVDATTGKVTFDPDANFTGDPSAVNYSVEDTEGNKATATITIDYPQTVPVANDDSVTNPNPAAPTNPTIIPAVANDTDPENDLDPATVRLVGAGGPVTSLVVNGEGTWNVNLTSGDITFTPEAGFTGDPTDITYTVKDKTTLESNAATVHVDYPQTAPIAKDDSKTGVPGSPVTVDLIFNDSDPENDLDPTTVKIIDPNGTPVTTLTVPNEGKWELDPPTGKLTFTPENGFTGDPTPVKYTVKDKTGAESNKSTVTVDYPQTPPTANDDAKSNSNPATPTNPTTIDVVANDQDPENDIDPTTVKLIDATGTPVTTLTVPNEGEWKADPVSGIITFTPEAGFTADPTPVKYTVDDKTGKTSNQATVTVDYPQTVPTAEDDAVNGTSGQPTTVDILVNDTDPENDIDPTTVKLIDPAGNPVTSLTVTGEGKWTVDPLTGQVTFTPEAGFTGDPTPVKYTVKDKTDKLSNQATITIEYPQSAPVAVDDSVTNSNPASPSNPTIIKTVDNDTDPENDLDPTTVTLIDGTGIPVKTLAVPNEGTWVVDPVTGDITFTPTADFTNDPTPVKYTVVDKTATRSNEATITVDYPQSVPVASNDLVTGISGTPTTVDVISNDSDPENDLDPETVKIIDPSGTPVTTLTIPNEGEWNVDPLTGKITFTPEKDFTGDPTPIKYTVNDKTGKKSNQAIVTVDYPQSPPVAENDSVTSVPGIPVTINVPENDSDPENDLDLSTVKLIDPNGTPVTTLTVPNEGEWNVDPLTGKVTFIPDAGLTTAPTPVKYTITDKTGNPSNQATLIIKYPPPPPPAPVATDDELLLQPLGKPITVDVLVNDSDVNNDIDPKTVKIVHSADISVTELVVPNEGTWTVDPLTGKITFTPEAGFLGDPTPIKYTVRDEEGEESNEATVKVTYQPSAALVGTVWLDRDKDGNIDPNEKRMSNWTLKVIDSNGQMVRETTTNAQGEYVVDGLIPAEYTVEFYNENGTLIAKQKTDGPLSPSTPGSHPVNLSLPIDPSGVMYDSSTRNPIEGVKLELLNASGTPVDSSCLGGGQQGQVTDATGMYAFDVNPGAHASCGDPETYTIHVVSVPTDYHQTSTQITGQPGIFNGGANEAACTTDAIPNSNACEVQGQPDAPTGNQPTTFFTRFTLTGGDLNIIFNHIPLDPKGHGNVLVSKVVNKHQASVGDMLYYQIDVANAESLPANDLHVVDNLPAGFKLADGSAKIIRAGADGLLGTADDSKILITPTGVDPMSFDDIDLAGKEKVRITYLLKVGASVIEGNHVNTARALNVDGTSASNIAKATVIIVAEAVIDQSTLIGKVFHDRDGDGYQDSANATGITIKGSNGFMKNLGNISGRKSKQDALSKHSKKVMLPLSSDNSFTVTTKQGTHIQVNHAGEITESHNGMKAKGITGQDLRVTTHKQGKHMEVTLTNHGIQEEGIPGVRLATVTGLLIETDGYGRFHIPDVDGGRRGFGKNFILKVDKATLPDGAEFTTENPRVLRLTGAALNKMNFGVKLPEQEQSAPARHERQPAQYRTSKRSRVVTSQQATYKQVDVNLGSIFFDKDKYNIREDQRGIMDDIANKIERIGHGHIIIDAFTDSRHNAAYNIKLAERRANTVRGELKKRLGSKLMRNVKVDIDTSAYKEIPHNDPHASDYNPKLLNGLFNNE